LINVILILEIKNGQKEQLTSKIGQFQWGNDKNGPGVNVLSQFGVITTKTV
jgi:hypothetical protein